MDNDFSIAKMTCSITTDRKNVIFSIYSVIAVSSVSDKVIHKYAVYII